MDSQNLPPYENAGPAILVSTLLVVCIGLFTTLLRLYVRVVMIRNVGWDVSDRNFSPFRILLLNLFTGLHDVDRSCIGKYNPQISLLSGANEG
jgi:hypothetical protein